MKFLLSSLLISLSASASDISSTLSGMPDCAVIINGTETTDYPAVGEIYVTEKFEGHDLRKMSCTATVIAPTKLLTAAHCVDDFKMEDNGIIWNGQMVSVKAVNIHPDYKTGTGKFQTHDMAVIELKNPLSERPHPIDLSPVKKDDQIELVGFGHNYSKFEPNSHDVVQSGSGVKRKGFNQIESITNGVGVFNGRMENRNIFGFSKVLFDQIDLIDGSDVSVAKGDSGGAVLRNGKLVGVISSSMSGVGLPNADMTYENKFTPLYTEANQNFLKKHLR